MAILITYFDEQNVWKIIGPEIQRRNPVSGVMLNVSKQTRELEKLDLYYIPHTETNWNTTQVDSFKKPFLWLYVLVCRSFAEFSKTFKDRLKVWISNMAEEEIEWLVLYIPTTSDFTSSESVAFGKAFDKISKSLGDRQKFTRLHADKAFLNLTTSHIQEDMYWKDFLNCLNRSLSNSISTRLNAYVQMIHTLDYHNDFYQYCMAQEGMGIIYNYCGLPLIANECYATIKKAEVGHFVPVSMQDILRNAPLTVDEFRIAMLTGSLSELSFRDYVFRRQMMYLEIAGKAAISAELALQFISACLRLFAYFPEENIGNHWVVRTAFELGKYYSEVAEEVSVNYAAGLLLAIARSRLERAQTVEISYWPFEELNVDGKLIEIISRLKGQTSFTPNKRLTKRYSLDLAVCLTHIAKYNQALTMLEETDFEKWDSINRALLAYRFLCYKQIGNAKDAIETGLKLLKIEFFQEVWDYCNSIESEVSVDGSSIFQISFDISKNSCEITSMLRFSVHTSSIVTDFFELNEIELQTGQNRLHLSPENMIQQEERTNEMNISLSKIKIKVPIPREVIKMRSSPMMSVQSPSIFIIGQVQHLSIQINPYNDILSNCTLSIDSSLHVEDSAKLLIVRPDNSRSLSTVQIANNTLKLPYIFPGTHLYIAVGVILLPNRFSNPMKQEILTKKLSSEKHSILFSFACELSRDIINEKIEKQIKFSEPISVKSMISHTTEWSVVQAVLANCSNVPVHFNSIEIQGCEVVETGKCSDIYIEPGGNLYAGFIVKNIDKPVIIAEFSEREELIGIGKHVLRHEHWVGNQDVVELQHGETGVVGQEFSISLSFLSPVQATVQVDSSEEWNVPERFHGVVEENIELKLIPMQKGTCELPEIFVWVGDKRLPVKGEKRVVCYTNDS